MRTYEITNIQRTTGMTQMDANRIGKLYFCEEIQVGRPAVLHHYDIEGRVMVTSPVQAIEETAIGLSFKTMNTFYELKERKSN